MEIFSKYILHVCIYICIINIHRKQTLILDAINRLTALVVYFWLQSNNEEHKYISVNVKVYFVTSSVIPS